MEPFFFFLLALLLLILILFLIFNCWICLLILLWSETYHWVLLPVKVKLFKKGKKIFVISFYSRREYKSQGDFSRCDAAPAVSHSWCISKTQAAVEFVRDVVMILSIHEKSCKVTDAKLYSEQPWKHVGTILREEKLRSSFFSEDKIIRINFNRCADVFPRIREIHVHVTVDPNVGKKNKGRGGGINASGFKLKCISSEGGLVLPQRVEARSFRRSQRTCSGCLPREMFSALRRTQDIPVLESLCFSASLGTPSKEVLGDEGLSISALPSSPG